MNKDSAAAKCAVPAEGFLEKVPHLNTAPRRAELAVAIQQLIENYIAVEDANYEAATWA